MDSRPAGERRPPDGFSEQSADVDGVKINYVRGGSGPTVVLVHGYPQTWYSWRKLMPRLAERYTVVAPDLRGSGGSDAPAAGYEKKTLARDIHGLLTRLGLDRAIRLVAHDIGSMVAYSYAAQYPDTVEQLVFCEAVIPDEGIYRMPVLTAEGPGHWNFGLFNVGDGSFPEGLVAGRELAWVRGYMLPQATYPDKIDEDSMQEYARCLTDEKHLRASFAYFRTLKQDMVDNAEFAERRLPMPVLAIGAKSSLGDSVAAQLTRYARNVRVSLVDDAGHYVFDEQPEELSRQVLEFLD